MKVAKFIKNRGIFLILAAGFLIMGSISALTLPLGSVWFDSLENGKMLISGQIPPVPAYPMWGYCLLVALMGTALIILQALLAFLFLLLCFPGNRCATFRALKISPSWAFQLVCAVLLIPWFFLATTSLTKSITSILICFATCCLYKGVTNKNLLLVTLAGVSFGLGYNIRNEVIILAFLYFLVLCIDQLRRDIAWRTKLKVLVSFSVSVVVFTVPWLIYTKFTIGHPDISATNGGAVKYLGLGVLPNNPWGIIPSDAYVWEVAVNHNIETPWGYEADQFFSNRFTEAVKTHPKAFFFRILRGWQLMFMQGLYFPDFRQLFYVDIGNHVFRVKKEYIPYDYLNEKLKEALHLKIDNLLIERYESEGMGFDQVKLKHWIAVLGEYFLRGSFALVFVCAVGALLFSAIRFPTWNLCITLPLACLGYDLFIAGYVQTLPSHTTQVWPVLIMFQLQSDKI
jgi:hypothetical protein